MGKDTCQALRSVKDKSDCCQAHTGRESAGADDKKGRRSKDTSRSGSPTKSVRKEKSVKYPQTIYDQWPQKCFPQCRRSCATLASSYDSKSVKSKKGDIGTSRSTEIHSQYLNEPPGSGSPGGKSGRRVGIDTSKDSKSAKSSGKSGKSGKNKYEKGLDYVPSSQSKYHEKCIPIDQRSKASSRGGSPTGSSRGGSPRGGSPRGGSPRGDSPRGGSQRSGKSHGKRGVSPTKSRSKGSPSESGSTTPKSARSTKSGKSCASGKSGKSCASGKGRGGDQSGTTAKSKGGDLSEKSSAISKKSRVKGQGGRGDKSEAGSLASRPSSTKSTKSGKSGKTGTGGKSSKTSKTDKAKKSKSSYITFGTSRTGQSYKTAGKTCRCSTTDFEGSDDLPLALNYIVYFFRHVYNDRFRWSVIKSVLLFALFVKMARESRCMPIPIKHYEAFVD